MPTFSTTREMVRNGFGKIRKKKRASDEKGTGENSVSDNGG
jgi:hypothetical protein